MQQRQRMQQQHTIDMSSTGPVQTFTHAFSTLSPTPSSTAELNSCATVIGSTPSSASEAPAPAAQAAGPKIPASDIALGRELGRGGMGTVRAAAWLGTPVAVKTLVDSDRAKQEELEQEAALLASLRHPCVCQFFGTCVLGSGHLAMVMELLDCSLHELIAGPKGYTVPLCFRLAHEIAQGIAFLHRNNVLHRDIKPANVMLDALLHAKVCDFGLSRDITADMETRQPGDVGPQSVSHSTRRFGTLRYMAPEVLCLDDKIGSAQEVKLRYNQQCDVYSFALLLWELAHREPPFMGTDATQVAQAARSGKRPQLRLPKGLADLGPLITSSWHVEPAQRPTMAACTEELLRLSQSPEASPVEGQLGAAEGGGINAESSFKM